MGPLEIWGGPECTVNRVGDCYRDQLRETGHHDRIDDLELFAELGLSAVRYPLLWERVASENHDKWAWSDERLTKLRELGIRPIAGLLHHGSGPPHTSLLSDDLATGLAAHAREAVERYPWILDWTPVNEPLTTARFAALYGHWYPHRRDEGAFWLALINQIDATRLAMREIRKVQPAARLVQTDDLGRTYATAAVRDQAAFDNVRRWMGWDLLCGRVLPGHDFWRRLCSMGFEDRLCAIADDPCPPDIIGINHYLSSDRFLDHRVQRYPPQLCGGNLQVPFIDTEAVRVLQPPPEGLKGRLTEAWERYRIPIAVTEVHNGCTREEQMRWTLQAWEAAGELRETGVEVCAITSWALFGSAGWNTLLTSPGRYEVGAYDISGGAPRPTAMAALLKSLSSGEKPSHPVLSGAGWWHRDLRLVHPPVPRAAPLREYGRTWQGDCHDAPPLLITGASGTLGKAMAAACRHRHIRHIVTSRAELDICDPVSIDAALTRHRPWAVINTAGWVRVDDAEDQVEGCMAANADGAAQLAQACGAHGIPSLSFSSDLVFDGRLQRPYVESDLPQPLNCYGRSKAEAERRIGAIGGSHLIVRTAAFFSPFDPHNFAVHATATVGEGEVFRAAQDQVVTPTYVPDLCQAALDLLIDGEAGIWHLTNGEAVSWHGFARMVCDACGLDSRLVEAVPGSDLGWLAPRPPYVPLGSERGRLLPPLSDAVHAFARIHGERAMFTSLAPA